MKKTYWLLALSLLLSLSPARAEIYNIDPAHTNIGFSVKHMVISNVKGQFREYKGSFDFDPDAKKLKSAQIAIKTASIDTGIEKRDNHLRSSDFLDAPNHPEIIFSLKSAKTIDGNRMTATGDLTIRGVTRGVTLEGEFLGAVKDPWGGRRAGFTAEGVINRFDYDVKWNDLLETGAVIVGKEVKLLIEVEGVIPPKK